MTIADIIPQDLEKDPAFIVDQKIMLEEVQSSMQNILSQREYDIISLRYGLNDGRERTQQEVADIMNISRSYISRIETKAIELLSENFANKK